MKSIIAEAIGLEIRPVALTWVDKAPEGAVWFRPKHRVGCAHPGIIPMLRQISASRKHPVHVVLGGFHLLQTPEDEVKRIVSEFKSMGIADAGPTHCTGDEAVKLFRAAYGAHFISGGGAKSWKVNSARAIQ